MKADCGHSLYWQGCYNGSFDLLTPESYAHPAKMAPALCFKILSHMEELGLLKDGDRICDPMAGTGMTNICAGAKGYSSISVELEDKFVGFQKDNKEYAERRLYKTLDWQILQGDSRRLSEILDGNGFKAVMSPPYADSDNRGREDKVTAGWSNDDKHRGGVINRQDYGQTPGLIGNLKDRPLKVVTSPPYGEAVNATKGGVDWEKANRPDRLPENHPATSVQGTQEWRYSRNPSNIGNLKDKPLKTITSPPYDGHPAANDVDPHPERQMGNPAGRIYGHTDGQIGDTHSESYLEAMSHVYTELAKVSDVLVVVVKNPTRNGKLRRLDLDTVKLLESTGWTIHCQHRALLFEEQETIDLFGETKKKVRGRMSFFKRLSWQNGQPVARWEDILVAVRKG